MRKFLISDEVADEDVETALEQKKFCLGPLPYNDKDAANSAMEYEVEVYISSIVSSVEKLYLIDMYKTEMMKLPDPK